MSKLSLSLREHEPGSFCVALGGELDLQHAYAFDEEMRRLEQRHPRLLVLDLRALSFVDCSGVARILALHRRARRVGLRVVMVRGSPAVRRLLALTAMDVLFEQVNDPGQVLQAPHT